MANLQRPSTSCQAYRPSLTGDNKQTNNNNNTNGGNVLHRSYTFDTSPTVKPSRPLSGVADQQAQRLGRSLLSNENWRQETMADLRLHSKAIEQSDQNILYGKGMDPLPQVRELVSELSNAEAFLYARQCRVVVAKLRFCWSDVNEEIKSLLKHKEYTEAAVDHIRKDIIINHESVNTRRKPKRESEPDGVDDMLAAEKYHLNNIKKILELTCRNVVDQMQKLNEIRQRVTKIGKERSLVTDLICQCLTSASRTFELVRHQRLESAAHRQSSMLATARPATSTGVRSASLRMGQNNNNNNNNNNASSMASSNANSNNANNSPESLLLDENGLPRVGHLLAFTPDVIQVFHDASKAIEEAREIKKQTMNQIKDAFNDAKAYSLTVNQGIAQKLADIITLAQQLTISLGENMLAQNRATRWHDLTTSAMKFNAGPVSSSYLKTPERLDRPIIRTFQRHPGNQVPEAQITAKATQNLQQSSDEIRKQLTTLQIVGQRLQANLLDKEVALGVDSQLLRRRRERSNHKWGATKYVHV